MQVVFVYFYQLMQNYILRTIDETVVEKYTFSDSDSR